jgi:hypothetical protein
MLRATPIATALLASAGCLWEPVTEAPTPGNADVAPIIEVADPNTHQVFVSISSVSPFCSTQEVGLPTVFSPRAVPLTARFFLNYLDPGPPPAPLSLSGQVDFPLQRSQGDPNLYTLQGQPIALDGFVSQLGGQVNELWVFVSDDFSQCPEPIDGPQSPSAGPQTLTCYTTAWNWVIEPNQCPLLNGF